MAHGNNYRNSVITTMTEILEEELGQKNVDVMNQDIQNAYAHLRYNLMELGLFDASEEQSGTMEDRIRNIARKGREYLESIVQKNAERPSDDWQRLFAAALGIPENVPELELADALVAKLCEIGQEGNDLQAAFDRAVEVLIENVVPPINEADIKALEEVAQLKQKLDEARAIAARIIDEAAAKLPIKADREEALAFAGILVSDFPL